VAPARYRRGEILDVGPGATGDTKWGTLVVVEANLSDHMPWDVAAWAEGHAVFPDDPTTDQNFSHRQFESYRRLGRLQMLNAFSDETVRADFGLGGNIPPEPSVPPPEQE
jgi:hypothetical protein